MRVGLGEEGGWCRAVRVVGCGRRGAACTAAAWQVRRAECTWRLRAGVRLGCTGAGAETGALAVSPASACLEIGD